MEEKIKKLKIISKDLKTMDLYEKCKELENYIDLEGSELGEFWSWISDVGRFEAFLGEKLTEKLEKEIDKELTSIWNDFEILLVTKNVTKTEKILQRK
jgi:hypothetical protein